MEPLLKIATTGLRSVIDFDDFWIDMSDGAYLMIALFLLSVVLSVIFRVAWKTLGRPLHARTWSWSFAVGALGYLVNAAGTALRWTSPFYFMVASLLVLTVSYLGARGFRERAGLGSTDRRFAIGCGATLAVLIFFNLAIPYQAIRIAVVPVFSAAMLFLASQAVDRQARTLSGADRLARHYLIVFACFELVLAFMACRLGRLPGSPNAALYNQVLLLGLPSFYIANGLVGLFLLASDLARRMEALAETDVLTGLLNRRGIEREAAEAISQSRSSGGPLTCVLADIDHFKRINDLHGHVIGDVALLRFSEWMKSSLSGCGTVGRLGGEEFVFLLPGMDVAQSVECVERVRLGVKDIALADLDVEPFTASFGIASVEADDRSLRDLLVRADIALYQAKATGRNRSVVFDLSQTPLHVARALGRDVPVGQEQ
jgi:diguanylate cyclase (GGDEF)-like protein